jgi:hypothetical protein
MPSTFRTTWARAAWQRAVAAYEAQHASQLSGAERLAASAGCLNRSNDRLTESRGRIHRRQGPRQD